MYILKGSFCLLSQKEKEIAKNMWILEGKSLEYGNRSDNAPATDSQDSSDHACQPSDPQVATTRSPKRRKH